MARMAVAAMRGGAKGIRANSVADIQAIKKEIDLPIIGIIKQDYDDSSIFITPTLKEIKALLSVGVDIIATDATNRKRPNDEKIEDIVQYVKEHAPEVALMADISSVDEAVEAERLGFDCISTTLVGYTKETKGTSMADHDFKILKEMIQSVSKPIIGEGQINTPLKAEKSLEHGAHFIVVGGAITRPQVITKVFVDSIHNIQ